MTDDLERGQALEEQIERLESRLGEAGTVVARFDAELARMQSNMRGARESVSSLSTSISRGLRRAFDGLVFDGLKASDALRMVGHSMVNATYSAAMRPVSRQLGGLLGAGLAGIGAVGGFAAGGVFGGGRAVPGFSAFARGGALSQGRAVSGGEGGGFAATRVRPFARGGVVTGPAYFPMRGGSAGLMGEAGPEAILPLARGADGRLGVEAGGTRPVQVVMNISTPDVAGFRRSQGQIAAQVGRALARGQRNR